MIESNIWILFSEKNLWSTAKNPWRTAVEGIRPLQHDEMDRGREGQGSTTASSNMSERDGKDQGEGSPKQACLY